MFLLATVLLFGLASAQKVTRLTSCITDKNQLRINCKYEPAADAQEAVVCKYTLGDRTLGSTDPDEPKDNSYKNRVAVSLAEKNSCQLSFDNPPDGKNNYTCNITQKETVSMMTMVEKKTVPPCSGAGSISVQTCTLLGLSALPVLLQISGLL